MHVNGKHSAIITKVKPNGLCQVSLKHDQEYKILTIGRVGRTRLPATSASNILTTLDLFSPSEAPSGSSNTTTKVSCHSTSELNRILTSTVRVISAEN